MYALRERRVHVTQEDFEMAVAKVCCLVFFWLKDLTFSTAQCPPIYIVLNIHVAFCCVEMNSVFIISSSCPLKL